MQASYISKKYQLSNVRCFPNGKELQPCSKQRQIWCSRSSPTKGSTASYTSPEGRCAALPSPLHHCHVTTGIPFAPDAELTTLAQRVGEVVGLELYGVDVLLGEAGPVVVDVNPFPGFRGVADAPRLIAEHLLHRVYT